MKIVISQENISQIDWHESHIVLLATANGLLVEKSLSAKIADLLPVNVHYIIRQIMLKKSRHNILGQMLVLNVLRGRKVLVLGVKDKVFYTI